MGWELKSLQGSRAAGSCWWVQTKAQRLHGKHPVQTHSHAVKLNTKDLWNVVLAKAESGSNKKKNVRSLGEDWEGGANWIDKRCIKVKIKDIDGERQTHLNVKKKDLM